MEKDFLEKVDACTSVEELEQLCQEYGYELTEEDLDNVTGGAEVVIRLEEERIRRIPKPDIYNPTAFDPRELERIRIIRRLIDLPNGDQNIRERLTPLQ